MMNVPLCIAVISLFACGTSGSKPAPSAPPSPTAPPSAPATAPTPGDESTPDPVSCRSVDDCWAEELPVPHAIARPPAFEGRTFRGCVDGEHVPKCVEGRCTLDSLKC